LDAFYGNAFTGDISTVVEFKSALALIQSRRTSLSLSVLPLGLTVSVSMW